MVRSRVLILGFFLGATVLGAQDLGRTDLLWHEYLSETVRRGLPLFGDDPDPGVIPFWPSLDRFRADAQILEPSDDVVLLGAWIDRAEGRGSEAQVLRDSWPRPSLGRFSPRQWGEALFQSWDASSSPREWTDAWLAWADKVYSPPALAQGLLVLEKIDPSAVVPLLKQALQLYPEDRRFLPLVALHPDAVTNAAGLLSRDRLNNGGWSEPTLAQILRRHPSARDLLVEAGYPQGTLNSSLGNDYGVWLASGSNEAPLAGGCPWDSDADGRPETWLTFADGGLQSWSRTTAEGLWTLELLGGKPEVLIETRLGASWTLRWESYPWAASLEYRWSDRTMIYRFRPLEQSIPLWPSERWNAPLARLPAALATLWLPLDPRALASRAASVETWEGSTLVETVFLFQGEVWLQTQDTNHDGIVDTWSYFRSGRLASVYHDAEASGQVNLREVYRKGELAQVHSRAPSTPRNEFVLFPTEGVQLWDPHGDGRPLDRLFLWSGGDRLSALVFRGDKIPWETMPRWEPRP